MLREVDELLNELAGFSKWSDEQRESNTKLGGADPSAVQNLGHTRTRYQILGKLLRNLNADEYELMVRLELIASALISQVQVILRDLRPILYRLPVGISSFIALDQYRSNAHHELTMHTALAIWHWAAPRIYRVRNTTDRALDECERIPRGAPSSTMAELTWQSMRKAERSARSRAMTWLRPSASPRWACSSKCPRRARA